MKKILAVMLLMSFILSLGVAIIPRAFAAHEAEVKWLESNSDVLAVSPILWPRWLNFTVKNMGPNNITEIKFVIQKDDAGNALFKFENSEHSGAADGWRAIPDEFGPDGYPTVIYFRADPSGSPLKTNEVGRFDIYFSDGPAKCNYTFDLWTSDDGSPSGIDHKVLRIVIDGEPPIVTIETPKDDETVYAIFDPYPDHWYFWINFSATDNPDHDSNISRVIVDILEYGAGPEWDIQYVPPYPDEVKFAEQFWDLEEGNYTLKVTIFDGAGNSEDLTVRFELRVETLVNLVPKKGTVGPTTSYDPETGLYTGTIYEYGNKKLGTEVKIEAKKGAFTPNSKVNVTVYGLPYAESALVLKNIETDSEGKFKETPSFVFPTAPHGTYVVEAVDSKGVAVPLEFTVIPEIIYKPVVVIGPAPIEVIATGLPANGYVSGLTCNGTDALLGTNLQVLVSRYGPYSWYTDDNGTLKTIWADKPGFLMPVLEPGTYEIGLNIITYEEETTTISNYLYVANDFKDLMDTLDELELKLDYIKPIIERIDDNVVTIKTDVGVIREKIENIEPKITDIQNRMVTIETIVGRIEGTIESIEGDLVYIKTNEGWDVRLKLEDILDAIPPPAPDVTLGINMTTVLSAIAAIAALVAAAVVIRRLKVAV